MMTLTHKAVLVILTNTNVLRKSQEETKYTGFDIHEVAHAWLHFHKKMNMKMVFASPKGGEAPIDPLSLREAEKDEAVVDLLNDRYLNDIFRHTQSLDHIQPEEYALVLIPGCHGAMVDLPAHPRVAQILHHIYNQENGIIATIGHGAAALLHLSAVCQPLSSHRAPFIQGRSLTSFTNEEEARKNMFPSLPYSLEDQLIALGAQFESKSPFESHVIVHERLITAQNTSSVSEWIQTISQIMHECMNVCA